MNGGLNQAGERPADAMQVVMIGLGEEKFALDAGLVREIIDPVPVTKVAKWKTTVQLIAIGFLIAGPAGDKIVPYVSEFGLVCLWIAAALTLYTGYDCFRAGIGHVMDDK